ncbi:hypothetical protein N9A28_03915 [Sulfurimonas sp.]|nr:hypothetical protein [Sulfurimonas sp.]
MKEIKLNVKDEHFETLLTIIENLNSELIDELTYTGQLKPDSKYKPRLNTIIKEEESGTSDTFGKYLNPDMYKKKLNK